MKRKVLFLAVFSLFFLFPFSVAHADNDIVYTSPNLVFSNPSGCSNDQYGLAISTNPTYTISDDYLQYDGQYTASAFPHTMDVSHVYHITNNTTYYVFVRCELPGPILLSSYSFVYNPSVTPTATPTPTPTATPTPFAPFDITQLSSNSNGQVTFKINNPPANFNYSNLSAMASWDDSNWAYSVWYEGGCPDACVVEWQGQNNTWFYIKLANQDGILTFNQSFYGGAFVIPSVSPTPILPLNITQLSSDGTGKVTFKINNPPADFNFTTLSAAASWDNSNWAYANWYEGGCPDACVVEWQGQNTTPFYIKLTNQLSSITFNQSVFGGPTYTLSGAVYNDANQNGIQDTGETGYNGAAVSLRSGQTTTTDTNGNYTFTTLPAATYTETLTLPNGYTATTTNPATVALAANTTENFGIAPANSFVTAINAGGNTQGNFVSDTDATGGSQYSSSASVDTSGVTNPAPQAIYQTVRYGNFTYIIPNLTANASYTLRLHFNELYWGTKGDDATGKRVFNVAVNGTTALTNYDIYQAAGGANKAVVAQLPATADSNGNITIQFSSVTDNAMVNGLEVYTGTLPSPTPTPTPTPTPITSEAINAGGTTTSSFLNDKAYTSGQPYSTTASVDTTAVTNPAPESVYQSVRYGNFTYALTKFVPNSSHTVRLHFNELYWGTALTGNTGGEGSRLFNVTINNSQVLTNFDIYQQAGGANKALIKEFTTTADANGKIIIQFASVADNAMVNGIEVN